MANKLDIIKILKLVVYVASLILNLISGKVVYDVKTKACQDSALCSWVTK